MSSAATLGTPCLVPVHVEVEGVAGRGFITRLSRSSAAISTDPELEIGTRLSLRFRRPTDNQNVELSGVVSELLPEGGLWRGRSAALVDLDAPLLDDFFGATELEDRGDASRRGSEPLQRQPPNLGNALQSSGLGKRRVADRPPPTAPLTPAARPQPPVEASPRGKQTQNEIRSLSSAWAAVDPLDEDDATAPPRLPGSEPDFDLSAPDVQETGSQPAVRNDPDDSFFGLGNAVANTGEEPTPSEDDFFGRFGRVNDQQQYNLPPGMHESRASLDQIPDLDDSQIGDELPVDAGKAPGLASDGYFDLGGGKAQADPPSAPIQLAESPLSHPQLADASFDGLLNTGTGHSPVTDSGEYSAPPIRHTISTEDARAPWEEDLAGMSLIPRNARITSAIPVTFWARGRRNAAFARNFSKEGLFLSTEEQPPVRGAIVRIEFPIEGDDGDSVPVRFNAEVRWHKSDRPSADIPEGFGVQILTFESPKDRIRYDELLLLILKLNADQERKESAAFQWGSDGNLA